jgi:hypothetical protein
MVVEWFASPFVAWDANTGNGSPMLVAARQTCLRSGHDADADPDPARAAHCSVSVYQLAAPEEAPGEPELLPGPSPEVATQQREQRGASETEQSLVDVSLADLPLALAAMSQGTAAGVRLTLNLPLALAAMSQGKATGVRRPRLLPVCAVPQAARRPRGATAAGRVAGPPLGGAAAWHVWAHVNHRIVASPPFAPIPSPALIRRS